MNQKGLATIAVLIGVLVLIGIAGYFVVSNRTPTSEPVPSSTSTPTQKPTSTSTPPPTPSPIPKPTSLNCTSDAECPAQYTCEAIQGESTVCAVNSNGQPVDPDCTPTTIIIKGICKVQEGYSCSVSTDCSAGNICHAGICTNPVGQVCSYTDDPVCGAEYQCIQDCGPPVARQDEPPPEWHCILNEQASQPRVCPICLSSNTRIDTPTGSVSVQNVSVGMYVWTTDKAGRRVLGTVTKTSHVPVPPNHQMVHLILDDGRDLFASPGHPTTDGRTIGSLTPGELYDGAAILSALRVPYEDSATYDLLPSGDTGFYWTNGILVGSTLH